MEDPLTANHFSMLTDAEVSQMEAIVLKHIGIVK
jgi:hypothetical protein